MVSKGDWLWKPANIKVENNGSLVYVRSSLNVHNPFWGGGGGGGGGDGGGGGGGGGGGSMAKWWEHSSSTTVAWVQIRSWSLCGLSLLLVLSLAPKGFSLGDPVFPSP